MLRKFVPDKKVKFRCGSCGNDATATEWHKSTSTGHHEVRRLPNMGGNIYKCPHCGQNSRASEIAHAVYGNDGTCVIETPTRHYSMGEEE